MKKEIAAQQKHLEELKVLLSSLEPHQKILISATSAAIKHAEKRLFLLSATNGGV